MKMSKQCGRMAVRLVLPCLTLLAFSGRNAAAAANDKIQMTGAAGIFFAEIFGHSLNDPFEVPIEMTSNGYVALDLGGQLRVPITDITSVYAVASGVVINGPGGTRSVRAEVGVGMAIGDRDLFAVVSGPSLFEYGQGTGGAINLVPKSGPIGSDVFAPEVNRDFRPIYSPATKKAVWGLNPGLNLPSRIGYVTENFFFKVKDAGESVPMRTILPPNGTGNTFDFFDTNYDINASYVVFKGSGAFFNGAYSCRQSDGVTFAVAESYTLASDNLGQINGVFLRNDREVFFDAAGGLYQADAEGASAPVLILANNTGSFGSGLLHDLDGDYAVISGIDNTGKSTIFRVNLEDFSVETIVQKGDVAPGGEIFEIVQRPGLSDELAVFQAFDSSFKPLGLYGRSLTTWEIIPFVRVGDIFDGREVRAVGFEPGAVHGMTVGATVYFTDSTSGPLALNESGAYLFTPDIPFSVPFVNISTRSGVGLGDDALIGGFIISENPQPSGAPSVGPAKQVVIRAIGPSLGDFGVEGTLDDPVLELHLPDGSVVMNDNWRETQEQEIIDSGLAPANDLESAVLTTLEPGAYTAIVRGSNGGTGVGLVEVYDLDGAAESEQANISTRGLVQPGDKVMIGGIIVGGGDCNASTMVLRAIGPSLSAFGVANVLEDPVLELHDISGALVATNDNWKETQQSELEASGLAPSDDRESALQIALGPGAYTAIVRGVDETSGVALVEAYNLEVSGPVAASETRGVD